VYHRPARAGEPVDAAAGRARAVTRDLLDLRFRADATELRQVRARLRQVLQACGCEPEFIETSVLAVDEALTNVMRHAYGGDPRAEVVLRVLAEGEKLIFRIRDYARPVELPSGESLDPTDLRPGGLGLRLMRQIMDTVSLRRPADGGGNLLEMTRRRGHGSGAGLRGRRGRT
jgi:anti-sigma regulatory factor (Ser/Thr protein kinase)